MFQYKYERYVYFFKNERHVIYAVAETTEIDTVIAENIARLIGDEYGAQIAVARKIGITPVAMNRIVKGRGHASPKTVAAIAAAIGVNEVDLYQMRTAAQKSADDSIAALKKAIALTLSVDWSGPGNLDALEALVHSLLDPELDEIHDKSVGAKD